jgi:soluble lytic murein transglycosylase
MLNWCFRKRLGLTVVLLMTAWLSVGTSGGPAAVAAQAPAPGASDLWMAPSPDAVSARARLARAVADFAGGKTEAALPIFIGATDDPVLGQYARLFAGRAHLALARPTEVSRMVNGIMNGAPSDALAESALSLAIDAALLAADKQAVFANLQQLASRPTSAPAANEFRLLQAALGVSNRAAAMASYRRLYFEYPAMPETADAIEEMEKVGVGRPALTREDLARHQARADGLFTAGRYADARTAFLALQPLANPESRELLELRIAECDLFLKKHAAAASALRALVDKPAARPIRTEAEFHYLAALKGQGKTGEYETLAREFAGRAEAPWSERTLNDLGTHFILADDDEKAADVFAEMYARFPLGAFADRAAWRSGWWSYKQKRFADAARVFEAAASSMRRADYRPSWLYWTARARVELGDQTGAFDAFRRVISDYRNSYYGRAAIQEAAQMNSVVRTAISPARLTWPATVVPAARPSNSRLIEHLLAAGMYDDAIAELRRLQASGQGSPLVDATIAYALNRQGKLRLGINAMRRAYPQFMSEGGEALPREILAVIFPIDHWPLLRSEAAAKRLDPFLVAALVAQESTFQADIKSPANAWGLMQILPATGRRYAATLGIKPFSTFRLVDPEVNVRIGTTYFADLVKRFGDVAPALAAYNAGPERVVRWLAERPGFDRDEFIDDIPFPETQNYVKRILGTAEDYRILYR